MSIVAIIMNLFLATLLIAALVVGWRLERRLKTLRANHEAFGKAVTDLDAAATRAAQALAALRVGTQEAEDGLDERIAAAKLLVDKLDAAVLERPRRLAADKSAAPARDDDWLDRGAAPAAARPAFTRMEPATTSRSRARIDDDLFEPEAGSGRLRAIPGGRL